MSKDERAVMIFESIHDVMRADALLKQASIRHDLVPTPRQISSDCGMAIELRLTELAQVRELLDPSGSAAHAPRYYRESAGAFAEIEPLHAPIILRCSEASMNQRKLQASSAMQGPRNCSIPISVGSIETK